MSQDSYLEEEELEEEQEERERILQGNCTISPHITFSELLALSSTQDQIMELTSSSSTSELFTEALYLSTSPSTTSNSELDLFSFSIISSILAQQQEILLENTITSPTFHDLVNRQTLGIENLLGETALTFIFNTISTLLNSLHGEMDDILDQEYTDPQCCGELRLNLSLYYELILQFVEGFSLVRMASLRSGEVLYFDFQEYAVQLWKGVEWEWQDKQILFDNGLKVVFGSLGVDEMEEYYLGGVVEWKSNVYAWNLFIESFEKEEQALEGMATQFVDVFAYYDSNFQNMELANLEDPITIEMPVIDGFLSTMEPLVTPNCTYFNETGYLSTEGLEIDYQTGDLVVSCITNHLSSFTVTKEPVFIFENANFDTLVEVDALNTYKYYESIGNYFNI